MIMLYGWNESKVNDSMHSSQGGGYFVNMIAAPVTDLPWQLRSV